MKTIPVLVLSLLVSTSVFAEDSDYNKDLKLGCEIEGSDRDGFNAVVINNGEKAWHCDVSVETDPSTKTFQYTNKPIFKMSERGSSRQNVGGESGLGKKLNKCTIEKIKCSPR